MIRKINEDMNIVSAHKSNKANKWSKLKVTTQQELEFNSLLEELSDAGKHGEIYITSARRASPHRRKSRYTLTSQLKATAR
jgi:hypothetical protein